MARDITKLHPFVRMLADYFVEECHKQGLNVKITDCVRTKEEQQDCINRGTSTVQYPYSYHCWGLAFDVCQNLASNAYPSDNNWWKRVGAVGKKLGLTWGGDWPANSIDRPHFELHTYGDTATKIVRAYGTPQMFFNHSDFKVITPTKAIIPTSVRKKIIWLQVKLNGNGYSLDIDGIYGAKTRDAVKKFWKAKTGKTCTGLYVSTNCIKML